MMIGWVTYSLKEAARHESDGRQPARIQNLMLSSDERARSRPLAHIRPIPILNVTGVCNSARDGGACCEICRRTAAHSFFASRG